MKALPLTLQRQQSNLEYINIELTTLFDTHSHNSDGIIKLQADKHSDKSCEKLTLVPTFVTLSLFAQLSEVF